MRIDQVKSRLRSVLGTLVVGVAFSAGSASADYLNYIDASFGVDTSASVGPDAAFDNSEQSGDLSDESPWDAAVSSTGSWGNYVANGTADQYTAWNGSSISTSGSSVADLDSTSGSGSVNWGIHSWSRSEFNFQVLADVEYSLEGFVNGILSSTINYVELYDVDSGSVIHLVGNGSFAFSGTLIAGINYRLTAYSQANASSDTGVESETRGFEANLIVVPAPSGLALLGLALLGRRRRRA